MKTMKSSSFLVLFTILLSMGCKEVKIHDGRIPEKYLPQAKTLAGVYVGNFDGKKARLEIIFDQDRPRLIYKDSLGEDVIHPRCYSSIHDLTRVVLHKKHGSYKLHKAIFLFHPGTCTQIEGRTLTLDFSGSQKFTLMLQDRTQIIRDCDYGYGYYPGNYPGPYPGWYPGNPRQPFCQNREYPHYLRGSFYKITP